jgi:hypothetical protein
MIPNEHAVSSTVPVPASVRSEILLVRDTGLVNMLDSHLVAAVLDALGMHEEAVWIQHNPGSYMAAVMFGMD